MAVPGTSVRVLRIVGWIVLGVLLALYVGFPTAMAIAAIYPSRSEVGSPPDGFREITITTEDGVALKAWYRESDNGAAIIVVHGAGGSRESMRRQSEMLGENGYGVLALDLRGHGDSDGSTNRLGWEGTRDIAAAVAFLGEQQGVRSMGALGSSMGGEVLLGASGECPEIVAVVADGATRRCTSELLALPSERPLVRNFTARVMYTAVQGFTRTAPPSPLLDEMLGADSTEFMLVAAGNNQLETAFNAYFAEALGERAELWVAPGVDHTGAFTRYPDEYEQRVLGFFARELSAAPVSE